MAFLPDWIIGPTRAVVLMETQPAVFLAAHLLKAFNKQMLIVIS
jgi:hypothetical protein